MKNLRKKGEKDVKRNHRKCKYKGSFRNYF